MTELFPVTAGVIVGIALARLCPRRLCMPLLVLLSVVLGLAASALSGELELSLGFIPIDVAEVLGVGLLTMVAGALWLHRPQRRAVRTRNQ